MCVEASDSTWMWQLKTETFSEKNFQVLVRPSYIVRLTNFRLWSSELKRARQETSGRIWIDRNRFGSRLINSQIQIELHIAIQRLSVEAASLCG